MATKAKRKSRATLSRWLKFLGACSVPRYIARAKTPTAAWHEATNYDRGWIISTVLNMRHTDGPREKCWCANVTMQNRLKPKIIAKFRAWQKASR